MYIHLGARWRGGLKKPPPLLSGYMHVWMYLCICLIWGLSQQPLTGLGLLQVARGNIAPAHLEFKMPDYWRFEYAYIHMYVSESEGNSMRQRLCAQERRRYLGESWYSRPSKKGCFSQESTRACKWIFRVLEQIDRAFFWGICLLLQNTHTCKNTRAHTHTHTNTHAISAHLPRWARKLKEETRLTRGGIQDKKETKLPGTLEPRNDLKSRRRRGIPRPNRDTGCKCHLAAIRCDNQPPMAVTRSSHDTKRTRPIISEYNHSYQKWCQDLGPHGTSSAVDEYAEEGGERKKEQGKDWMHFEGWFYRPVEPSNITK